MNSTTSNVCFTTIGWRAVRSEVNVFLGLTAPPTFVLVPREQVTQIVEAPPHRLAESVKDPKDLLMDDEEALRAMYAEFEDEDRALAELGIGDYNRVLQHEESFASMLSADDDDLTPDEAWHDILEFINQRMAKGTLPGTYTWNRKDAYEHLNERYGPDRTD